MTQDTDRSKFYFWWMDRAVVRDSSFGGDATLRATLRDVLQPQPLVCFTNCVSSSFASVLVQLTRVLLCPCVHAHTQPIFPKDPTDPFVKHYKEISNGRIEFHTVDLFVFSSPRPRPRC